MGTLRLLIVDDEQPARERLRRLVSARPSCVVVGEAADGLTAIDVIRDAQPDVVLLDIQMPGASGLDVVAALPAPRPAIVFCTAFDQHAIDAFELHALDYLLKPVSQARLDVALDRVALRATDGPRQDETRISAACGYPTRLVGKRGTRHLVVPTSDVLYIASQDGMTRVQTREGHAWLLPTLQELEQRLDPHRFFRVSRNAILALDAVRELLPVESGGDAVLVDGTRIGVSRRRFGALIERLGQT